MVFNYIGAASKNKMKIKFYLFQILIILFCLSNKNGQLRPTYTEIIVKKLLLARRSSQE